MKKIKFFIAAALAAIMLIGTSMTAFASGWVYETEYIRKYYIDADNTEYLSDGWYWIDDNGDGIEECYYFYEDGMNAMNKGLAHMTHSGNDAYVNNDGMWQVETDPASVQRRVVGTTLADVAGTIDKSVEGRYYLYHEWRTYAEGDPMSQFASYYDNYYEPYHGNGIEISVPDDETVIMVNYYNNRTDRVFNKDYDGDYINELTTSCHCTKITFPAEGVMVTDLYDGWYNHHYFAEYIRY